MNYLCTICARAGSTGVPNKNIKQMLDKPLIGYTIEQAIKSGLFQHVIVSTDSKEIANIAKSFGAAVPFLRSPELANSTIAKWPAIRHAVQECEKINNLTFDIIIDMDPTSPLRSIADIKNCVDLLEEGASNVITAMPARRSPYFNLIEKSSNGHIGLSKEIDPPVTCRQDSPKCFDMNASIYGWKRKYLFEHDIPIFLESTALYVMPEERSIDIDSKLDFEFVEYLLQKKSINLC